MTKQKQYRLMMIETGKKVSESNSIIKAFDEINITSDDISILVPAIPAIKKFAQNAKMETKLALLTGEYVGKEHIVYEREKSITWFIDYLSQLPKALEEALKRKIIEEEKKKLGQ